MIDVAGGPIANAQVTLVRHTIRVPDAEGLEILAHGQTDAQGRFGLGMVTMKPEVAFPLENGVLFEFGVRTNGEQRPVTNVNFSAPRATDATVESVSAEISVH